MPCRCVLDLSATGSIAIICQMFTLSYGKSPRWPHAFSFIIILLLCLSTCKCCTVHWLKPQMQEEGLDTVDANRALGLPDDCREYSSVKNILKDLRIKSIRLMVRLASPLADCPAVMMYASSHRHP